MFLVAGIFFLVDFVLCITTRRHVFPPQYFLDPILGIGCLAVWWFAKRPEEP